jgi:hypothetical protein
MTVTFELPYEPGAALQAQAQAQGVSVAGFTRHVIERAMQPRAGQKLRPKKSAYGLLAKYGRGPSDE